MKSRTKDEASRIIHSCALDYSNNLVNNNILFITTHNQHVEFFEVAFLPRNFLHLTGVKTKLSSVDFYNLAVKDRLSVHDFQLTEDGITNIKLDILPSLMNIHTSARMAGDYDNSKSLLITDKFAGTISSTMGFLKTGSIYIPNTALNADIRNIIKKPIQRVSAIFRKKKAEDKYYELTYIAKGLTIDDAIFSKVFKEKINIEKIKASFEIPRRCPNLTN